MTLRKFSSSVVASAIVVAATAVAAHAHASGGTGAVFGGAFDDALPSAGAAARGSCSPGIGGDGPNDGSASRQAIELARCPNARAAAPAAGRTRRAGGSSGARKKASIWNIRNRGEAAERSVGESNRRGGFYDEEGNYHSDGPVDMPTSTP